MNTPILTITLNPTVDLATKAASVDPGPKLRCEEPSIEPGGGGVNVARAIAILGGKSDVFMAAGGPTGDHLEALLRRVNGLFLHRFEAPGETRQSFAVTERETGDQYRFVMPGPSWRPADEEKVLESIAALAPAQGYVVLSGSQPPGISPEFPARLAGALPNETSLIVDTSGGPLHHSAASRHPPFAILRMDQAEAEELAACPLVDVAASARFARALVDNGVARAIVVARGKEGSILATSDAQMFCASPDVPVRSKIGAGDSFVGAMVLSLVQGHDISIALCKGTAAASAAVMTDSTRLCLRADVERLAKDCVAQPL